MAVNYGYRINQIKLKVRDKWFIGFEIDIYSNSAYDVYSGSGSIYAENNWWGSNSSPISKVHGNVYYFPWIMEY